MSREVEADPQRLLAAALRVGRRLSRHYCSDDCGWYHGIRPYWRVLGLAMSPEQHAEFYHNAFAPLAASARFTNILVSGTADHAMPAIVLDAWRASNHGPSITVVDRCPTPLLLSRWYARQHEQEITVCCGDIRDHQPERQYDVVCSHFFITWFAPTEREGLFRCWHEVLRPGGRLLTVTRLRPAGAPDHHRVGLTAREQDAFVDKIRERAQRLEVSLDLPVEQLVDLAQRYSARRSVYTVRSLDELTAQLQQSGFAVDVELLPPLDPDDEWRSETNVRGAVDHAGIVATRLD